MGVGLAFAAFTFIAGTISSKQKERKIESAQREQRGVEQAIRTEQEGRERRRQTRVSRTLSAQIEAQGLSQTAIAGAGSGVLGATSAVSANLSRNLGAISTSAAQSKALSSAQQGVFNAGRPSTFDIFTRQAAPLVYGNIEGIDRFFESSFSSDTGT